MNKKTVKFVTPILATSIVFASLAPATLVHADETSENTTHERIADVIALTDADTLLAGEYISFNTAINQFVIDNAITNVLSPEKIKLIEEHVNLTNNQINETKTDLTTVVTAIDPSGNESTLNNVRVARAAGVNSVSYHWNYARIKIKASSLNFAVQSGFAIGSVYAPARIVQGACAVAGVGLGLNSFKNGIWFDYNYLVGVLCGNAGKQ
ncbi:hypothetical protein [Listeria cornellensis]|uniref:Uncharacterized protein n=1 Tax=Listeria cornellensis FSL F6-0969 TaxID=1265820 RepID=W7BV79_9LIST|nr:hypothetical protein [Listeria cornellensis]EUJ30644.1 hypothetical protein PCORN_08222 [Listeria cornellensis FSL F6-0969]